MVVVYFLFAWKSFKIRSLEEVSKSLQECLKTS